MKVLITLILIIGFIFLILGYIYQLQKCPPPRIEYKYIPRTFEESQDNPIHVSLLYEDIFKEPDIWVAKFRESSKYNKLRY